MIQHDPSGAPSPAAPGAAFVPCEAPRPALPARIEMAAGSARLPARVHLVGAGGAGVSGAAILLAARGIQVTTSDRAESEHTALLRKEGIAIAVGRDAPGRMPEGTELVVRSAAVPLDDPIVRDALERGVAVLKYSEMLGRLAPAGRTLAVAGTHGKTTTSWMLHHALRGLAEASAPAAARPGALIGGICKSLQVNAVAPQPDGWFAVEACEYDRSFLHLAPQGAAITNVEADHLDYYGDLDAIKSAFARFADRIHPEGLLVCGAEVPRRVEAVARTPVWRLGRELKVHLLSERNGQFTFRLRGPDFHVPSVSLAVPGSFNVDNAALALALAVGVAARASWKDLDQAALAAARGLERFCGSGRRFESWGRAGDVEIVHDYAHHPTEVRVTLEAARRALPGRPLHVLFQPHQYSRTARFLREFAESLRFADRVVVADVYGARNHIDGEHVAGAQELVSELASLGVQAVAGGKLSTSIGQFASGLAANAAALVLGAGDIGGIRDELLEQLAVSGAARSRTVG